MMSLHMADAAPPRRFCRTHLSHGNDRTCPPPQTRAGTPGLRESGAGKQLKSNKCPQTAPRRGSLIRPNQLRDAGNLKRVSQTGVGGVGANGAKNELWNLLVTSEPGPRAAWRSLELV